MKKTISSILLIVFILTALTGCVSTFSEEKYNELASYVTEKGVDETSFYRISYSLSELDPEYEGDEVTVALTYFNDKSMFFESTREEDGAVITVLIDCTADVNNQRIRYNHFFEKDKNNIFTYGLVSGDSFSSSDRSIKDFGDMSTSDHGIDEETLKSNLGDEAHKLLTQAALLLKKLDIGITLKDLGYKNYQ